MTAVANGQLELVVEGRTLTELAELANREHDLAFEARNDAVMHALTCGAVLVEAKRRVGHGNWLPWLEANFAGSERTARNFMSVAANRQRVADLEAGTFREVLAALSESNGRRLEAVYSSGSDDWSTPAALFDLLDREFRFELDVCASPENAKCARYFTVDVDGLAQRWTGACWMNPPYGDAIGAWMAKAHASARAGATVVCLVPARTDTAWWWDHARHGEVRFLRGRLRFGDAQTAPFPSAVVVFASRAQRVVWWEDWPT